MVISISRQCLLSAFLLASLIQSSQNCPTNLTNSVVYEGNQTSFQSVNHNVKWQVAPSNLAFLSVQDINPNYDNNVDPKFSTTYAVNSSQLTIFNSTVEPQGSMPYSTSGIYILNYQNPACQTGAGLTVIRSGPTCSVDVSNPSQPKLNCTVVYANYIQQQINPIMTWTNSSGDVVLQEEPAIRPRLDINNQGLQSSTSLLPITITDAQTYECQLTFSSSSADNLPSFVDRRAPNFTASCFAHYTPPTTTGAPTTSTPSPSSQSTTTNTVTTPTQPQTTTSTTTPSTISSSSAASSISPSSSTTPTTAPPSDQTTSLATPIISGISANQAEAQAYAIVLSLVFGSVFALATVCFCWCCCCCKFPPPAGKTRRRRRRRGPRKPFFSWLMNYDSDNNDGI